MLLFLFGLVLFFFVSLYGLAVLRVVMCYVVRCSSVLLDVARLFVSVVCSCFRLIVLF